MGGSKLIQNSTKNQLNFFVNTNLILIQFTTQLEPDPFGEYGSWVF